MPRKLKPPYHSLDPADWWMYADLLLDQGIPEEEARWARQAGDSLSQAVELVLVFHCPANYLKGHRLQIARTWFIPVKGTHVEYTRDFQWFHPKWVRAGFARYPCDATGRFGRQPDEMIAYASGTPWRHDYAEFDKLKKKFGRQQVVARFFQTHGLAEQPEEWR
jgi:hypothetical protein